jgi:trafficking protein particle complex subunit 10
MPTSRIKISYSAPVNFLASDQWIQIRTALDERLPLRNLHWKAATDDPVRTIQELEVDFISLDSMKDEGSSQVPASLLERPFMNLFIFACEASPPTYCLVTLIL